MNRSAERPRRVARNQRGTTLIECVVAIVLFAIAAAAIGDLLTEQIRMQRSNGTTSTAISVAAGELEDVRTLNYADMANRSSTTVVDGVTYNLETSVAANAPQQNMKTVHTTVVWTEPTGAKSYTLHSIYTDVTH